jgi:hypothetical protein
MYWIEITNSSGEIQVVIGPIKGTYTVVRMLLLRKGWKEDRPNGKPSRFRQFTKQMEGIRMLIATVKSWDSWRPISELP